LDVKKKNPLQKKLILFTKIHFCCCHEEIRTVTMVALIKPDKSTAGRKAVNGTASAARP